MAHFLTSDHHFGHRNISRLAGRPFPDTDDGVAAMNETLIAAWNSAVADTDVVTVLGDFAMGRIEDGLEIVGRLNGTKHLISGNHDRCWPGFSGYTPEKVAEWVRRYEDAGFASVASGGVLFEDEVVAATPNREGVLLDHFPYVGDSHHDDRYADRRPADQGGWLVHGHVHEAWRQRGRQINVGVDAWAGRPVAIAEVAELIAAGENDVAPMAWVR